MESFTPNAEILAALTAMGIEGHIAEQALFKTGNQSCDAAIAYVFDRGARPGADDDPCKMVFVVNEALQMSPGKVAAQVAHACLALYRNISDSEEDVLESWEESGEKKVVLKGLSHLHLRQLEEAARERALRSYLVRDAGRTQVPAGSPTVLAVFGPEDQVDNVTGDLDLLH